MKKYVSIILACICICGIFAGCKEKADTPEIIPSEVLSEKSNDNEQQTSTPTEDNPQSNDTDDKTAYEEAAENYIYALLTKDYEAAVCLMGLDIEGSVVTGEDIAWYLPRSSFSEIEDVDNTDFKLSSDGYKDSGKASVTVRVEDTSDFYSFDVAVVLNNDNEWVVEAPEFYVENYSFKAPGGQTIVAVNGIELGKECVTNKDTSWTYTLKYTGKRDLSVRVYCDNFDETIRLTPVSNNTEAADARPNLENTDEALEAVKDLWNRGYEIYNTEGSIQSDLYEIIATDADTEAANMIWDGFTSLMAPTNFGNNYDFGHRMTKCVQREGSEIFWITDSIAVVNFGYELTWTSHAGWDTSEDMHRLSHIYLEKEDGKFVIYSVTDTNLFSWCNTLRNEWQ